MARVPVELDPAQISAAAKAIGKFDDEDSDSSKIQAVEKAVKGVSPMMAARLVYAAEVKLDPSLKFKATAKNIVQAREPVAEGGMGMRWERVVARTGLASIGEVKNVLLDAGVDPDETYVGRGKRTIANGNSFSPKAKKAEAEKPKRGPGRPKKSETDADATGTKVRKRQALKPRPSRT
jgi:hypothetical protein